MILLRLCRADLKQSQIAQNQSVGQTSNCIVTFHTQISDMKHFNKRPMGHIAHLRNQFKSMNTFEQSYDNIYYKTGPVVQEKKIFQFHECTFTILLLSPNVKRCGLVVLEKMIFQICQCIITIS